MAKLFFIRVRRHHRPPNDAITANIIIILIWNQFSKLYWKFSKLSLKVRNIVDLLSPFFSYLFFFCLFSFYPPPPRYPSMEKKQLTYFFLINRRCRDTFYGAFDCKETRFCRVQFSKSFPSSGYPQGSYISFR